ncbi:MAG: hypothetical protein HRT68_15160 [Flavobacteriaceae bacterium]|nr:hypothetical protein [Flavobacteriaceae bacterium]
MTRVITIAQARTVDFARVQQTKPKLVAPKNSAEAKTRSDAYEKQMQASVQIYSI